MHFNSRPSARGDVGKLIRIYAYKYFNSRPSARGDRFFQRILRWLKNFNSRPSARGDMSSEGAVYTIKEFQFTPLREGRLSHRPHPRKGLHFNSRPSARGDYTPVYNEDLPFISIHAPPRGATESSADGTDALTEPFQFTPLREGRPRGYQFREAAKIFQFTPLREGRRPSHSCKFLTFSISIHAPPRGATRSAGRRPLLDLNFNSRPSARGDRRHPPSCPTYTYFNSRPSARGDEHFLQSGESGTISIHAPPRGATGGCTRNHLFQGISIHAPPRGATSAAMSAMLKPAKFQFTPLREGRRGAPSSRNAGRYFNSRPSARGDLAVHQQHARTVGISIHAPPRGATSAASQQARCRDFNSRPSARGDRRGWKPSGTTF